MRLVTLLAPLFLVTDLGMGSPEDTSRASPLMGAMAGESDEAAGLEK